MKLHFLYLLIFITLITSCSKKKYATFCPGEKTTRLAHKKKSEKEKQKVFVYQTEQQSNSAEVQNDEAYASVDEYEIPADQNPIKERITRHRAKLLVFDEPEKIQSMPHRGSISAFVIFFAGSILGLSVIGMVWAIYNLFFLANKKKQFTMKGLSLTVVIMSAITFGLVAALLFVIEYNIYYNPGIMIVIGILAFLFFVCIASIFYYFAGENLFK